MCSNLIDAVASQQANTFQAVIIDTPVFSGSIHSPYKQPVGRRLARGGLDLAYGMKDVHSVDPFVKSVTSTSTSTSASTAASSSPASIVITVGGLGSTGIITAVVGSLGFEVLGNCAAANDGDSNTTTDNDARGQQCDGPCLCWASVPIASATTTTVTLNKGIPDAAKAVRYLWYIAPYKTVPFQAPIYATGAPPLPGANASMSNPAWDLLPLGPFVLHL